MADLRYLRKFKVGAAEIVQNWDDPTKWGALCGDVLIDRRDDGYLVRHRHDGSGAFHVQHGFLTPEQGHRKVHRSFLPALLHAAALVRAYEAARRAA